MNETFKLDKFEVCTLIAAYTCSSSACILLCVVYVAHIFCLQIGMTLSLWLAHWMRPWS